MLNTTQTQTSFPGAFPLPKEVRCLLLDDSNFDRARIRRLSQKTNLSIHLDEVDSIAQLDLALARENYDLIIIDYRLPVGDGMVALDHVLRNAQNCDAGKIMITGDGARQTAVRAMRAGCHDFLAKEEMSVEALREAMINALATAHRRQRIKQEVAHHKELVRDGLIAAMHDGDVQDSAVTFLKNRFGPKPSGLFGGLDPDDVDALLAGLDVNDGFIFH